MPTRRFASRRVLLLDSSLWMPVGINQSYAWHKVASVDQCHRRTSANKPGTQLYYRRENAGRGDHNCKMWCVGWGMLYCGGVPPVMNALNAASKEFNIDYPEESFSW